MARELLENAAIDIAMSDLESIGSDYDVFEEVATLSDYDLANYVCQFVYEILN